MGLHEIVYASIATRPMGRRDLSALLSDSRRVNAVLGITGLLVYHAGIFLQLLEGERTALSTLYSVIAQDKRHQQVDKIWDAGLKTRSFSGWSMAFINPQRGFRPEGYVALTSQTFFVHSQDATGKKILLGLHDHLLRHDAS